MDKSYTNMDELKRQLGQGSQKKAPQVDFNQSKIGAESLLGMAEENILPIIDPILQPGGIMQIFGERGTGKTYFASSLAYALATGGNFLKFKVPVAQKIAYLDGEMGHLKFKPYLAQAMKNGGQSDFPGNFDIISSSMFEDGEFPPLELHLQGMFNFLTQGGYNGVIIDNIATCTDIDENDPKAWKPFQKWCIRLRHYGIWTIFVAHAGLDKTRARGITHREDVLNTVISLQRSEEAIEGAKKIKVIFTKDRDFPRQSQPFYAIHHNDGSWTHQDIVISTYEKVIHWFQCGANGVYIARVLGIEPQTVSEHKQRAVQNGRLIVGAGGKVINQI